MDLKRLKSVRQNIDFALGSAAQKRYLSPTFLAQYRQALPLMRKYAGGALIDLGCGTAPFRGEIEPLVDSYLGTDIAIRSAEIQLIADMESMEMIRSGSFDTALCIEVLEHVPHPWRAVAEMQRILAPGGHLIMTVPHLSRLHDEPHDYFRYTHYALRSLFEEQGFQILHLEARGGLFSFLGHQLSTILVSLFWNTSLRSLSLLVNKWCVTLPAVWLDRHLDRTGLFPHGYILVARKPLLDG